MKKTSAAFWTALSGAVVILAFQNCTGAKFEAVKSSSAQNSGLNSGPNSAVIPEGGASGSLSAGGLDVCGGVSCVLTPLTSKPAVTTILLALGDSANSQLVINGASSQLIAETVMRYTSPISQPKILLVLDRNNNGESPEDTIYVKNNLLARYSVVFIEEPSGGLLPQHVTGYDVIWFNNPGHSLGQLTTRDTLIGFSGGVVLQGDDLSRGNGFSVESLTGLRHINNGTSVICGGQSYDHNNNTGEKYRIRLSADLFPTTQAGALQFVYGNDLDLAEAARPDLEVMAVARGGPLSCTEERPAIVRYLK